MEIPRNAQTAAEYWAGNSTNQHVATGYISIGEELWFRVTLPVNANTYLSINTLGLYADVYSTGDYVPPGEENLIFTDWFTKASSKTGAVPKRVNISTAGDYLIRIYGSNTNNASFRLTMGNANYDSGSYVHTGTSMTLTPTVNTVTQSIDLTNVSAIPDGAIVHTAQMLGTITDGKVSSSENRGLKHTTDSAYQTRSLTPWQITYTTVNRTAKVNWSFQWKGTITATQGSCTYVPQITFRYVYPLTPESF